MKKKLSLDSLKIKSFVTSDDGRKIETIKGGGKGPSSKTCYETGPWSVPCPYYTEVDTCEPSRACPTADAKLCASPSDWIISACAYC